MAEKDLNHAVGNKTCQEMLSAMRPKRNLKGNAYGQQSKAPFTSTSKKTQKGWAK